MGYFARQAQNFHSIGGAGCEEGCGVEKQFPEEEWCSEERD